MTTIDELLTPRVSPGASNTEALAFPSVLQGFPETAHGGSVLAAFDRLALPEVGQEGTPRRITARIQKPVPLETMLSLALAKSGSGAALTLARESRLLAEGVVEPVALSNEEGLRWNGRNESGEKGWALPTSTGCLACGRENPIGLRLQLRFDEEMVWIGYRPPETFRTPSGHLAIAFFTVVLDEVAWWLGALASEEAGVTTEISVTLDRPFRVFGEPVAVFGRRDGATPADQKGRYWRTEAAVFSAAGERLAWGRVIYAASRVYSSRLIPKMLAVNSPESLRRVFPRHVS